ncbi:hypothetical protein [Niveispirillum fermenti]|uniref:hypothetical protein n=1 Tax=Niveispirillum fermenti TaxID=1233113 RepID=UPI003A856AB8
MQNGRGPVTSPRCKVRYDPQNAVSIAQPGYGLLNARTALRLQDGDLEIALYGKNLTDRQYIQSGVSFLDSFGFAPAGDALPGPFSSGFNGLVLVDNLLLIRHSVRDKGMPGRKLS